jgi:hypothetical protein
VPVHIAQQRADGRIALRRIDVQRALDDHRQCLRAVVAQQCDGRCVLLGGRFAGEHREQQRGKVPLIRPRRRMPAVILPLRGIGEIVRMWPQSGRQLVLRQHPFPTEQPESAARGQPDGIWRDRAVRGAGIVQVRQRTSGFAQHLHGKRDRFRAESRHA